MSKLHYKIMGLDDVCISVTREMSLKEWKTLQSALLSSKKALPLTVRDLTNDLIDLIDNMDGALSIENV